MELDSRRRLAEALIPIARRAGDVICSLQKTPQPSRSKRDGSPITPADLASHDILYAGCRALTTTIPVVSEEDENSATKALNAIAFIIDPLDGTKEFISGRDEFTINVALVEDGRPTIGLIYAPARGRLFFSYGGGYAFEEKRDGQRSSLADRSIPSRKFIALTSRSHLDQHTRDLLFASRPCVVHKLGSALKFALIAAAEADAYVRLSPTMIWDCAAGQALVEATGGVVLRTDGSPLLTAGCSSMRIDGFIAARTPQLAARLIKTMQETSPSHIAGPGN
ncbi:3'(2'),5'-bisphosphate nucleotidase CysQ [Rhizobium sp. P40RR-XXII]|uniref:3'(2'),5'-bisphosphate nucleotidase CysQ family protein n=1 Tax=Rhizobium sp. P40RR-XXII TaxID=2726739 RepID=UPI001456B354|nr:3'(2'),5'-bisphosphate nucleotidase CysQ [Rhizobium sp. P40RR-XXII]NLS20399.1 3'(2'),5'-bisphosphate nucleotidase CysQ [Rhizobium sp. P40RR-XXII]